jgi:recombination protein RecA
LPTKEARKDLKDARVDLKKKFGDGAVVLLGEEEPSHVPVITTGLISLDYAIRHPDPAEQRLIGGIPRGRITELFGPEGGGKSTLLMQIFGHASKVSKRYCALIDSEHTFDPDYAARLGVDVPNLVVSQPSCGEEALEIADRLIRSGSMDLVAIDSAAMITPKAEIEGEMGDAHVGGRARLLTQVISKLVPMITSHDVAVIFINQLREQIGYSGYGDGTNTPGGRSLKHNASLRIEVRRIGMLKISDKIVGGRVRFRIAKNKLGNPFQDTQADLIFGQGFSYEGDLIDFAVERGVMKKAGATYEFGEEKWVRGREALRQVLIEDSDLANRVAGAVFANIGEDRGGK